LLYEKLQSIFVKEENTLHTIAGKIRSIQDGYYFLPSEGVQELITRMKEKKDLEQEHYAYQLWKHGLELTRKEVKISYFLRLGLKNKDIARILLITEGSVQTQISRIYKKIGANRREVVINLLNTMTSKTKSE
jgi:DNA-binding NarL/FixJ family response regulator